jgi:arylsulfatase A-like enzyme
MDAMCKRAFLTISLAGLLRGMVADAEALPDVACAPPHRPDVILFLVDDMGWMDSTVYGSRYYETPNMQRLAARGMMFTDAYAANPLCSPTRASLMTGKYPGRMNLTMPAGHLAPEPDRPPLQAAAEPWQKVLTPNARHFLPLDEYTLAEAFRDNGYATAFIGKWHLGHEPWWPEKNGFDINIAGGEYAGPPSYFSPYMIKTLDDGPPGEYLTDRLTDEAVKYIQQSGEKPYFLCLWHYAVHSPFQEKEEVSEKYRHKKDPRGRQDCAVMAAMIEAMDEGLGRVLDALDATGQADNTIFVFMSDNGGNMYDSVEGTTPTSNAPLRSGKGSIYEGGVRVPCLFVWPSVVKGGTQSDTVISSIDVYPTLLEMAGLAIPQRQVIDGISLVPHLRDGRPLEREALFCHFPHYIPATLNLPSTSVRKGPWKLIRFYGEGPDRGNKLELYNLDTDIGEAHDLADDMPALAAELDALITRHLEETGSVVPKPNPGYVPGATHPDFAPPPLPVDGWTAHGCDLDAEGGRLIMTSRGGDPYLMSETFEQQTGPVVVEIEMSSTSSGVGQLFYKGGDEYYTVKRRQNFAVEHDGEMHVYRVIMPKDQRLDSIRIDPCMAQGRVEFETVTVLDAAGAVVKRWDFEHVQPPEQAERKPVRIWP